MVGWALDRRLLMLSLTTESFRFRMGAVPTHDRSTFRTVRGWVAVPCEIATKQNVHSTRGTARLRVELGMSSRRARCQVSQQQQKKLGARCTSKKRSTFQTSLEATPQLARRSRPGQRSICHWWKPLRVSRRHSLPRGTRAEGQKACRENVPIIPKS